MSEYSKWEYEEVKTSETLSRKELNEYGKNLWQLVTVLEKKNKYIYIFKRALT